MEKAKEFLTVKNIIVAIISIMIILFAFQNLTPVTINFIFFTLKCPLLFLILILFALGLLSGWMVKQKDIKKTINAIKDELK